MQLDVSTRSDAQHGRDKRIGAHLPIGRAHIHDQGHPKVDVMPLDAIINIMIGICLASRIIKLDVGHLSASAQDRQLRTEGVITVRAKLSLHEQREEAVRHIFVARLKTLLDLREVGAVETHARSRTYIPIHLRSPLRPSGGAAQRARHCGRQQDSFQSPEMHMLIRLHHVSKRFTLPFQLTTSIIKSQPLSKALSLIYSLRLLWHFIAVLD